MAKYVIAGKSDCPFYAVAELLGDELHTTLEDFKVHKIVIQPDKWDEWVKNTCKERNWSYKGQSPIIWRELIDRGGKGILIGSSNDFLEMASGYYGIKSDILTEKLQNIAQENKLTKDKDDIIVCVRKEVINPMKICVTAGASDISYHMILGLCNGRIFLDQEDIVIHLLDEKSNLSMMQGICMELTDSAPLQLRQVLCTTKLDEAFKGADLIIVLDSSSLITNNAENYSELLKSVDFSKIKTFGKKIGELANKNAKVLVAGGPSNLTCNILLAAAGNVKRENFLALSRLHENRSKSKIAKCLNVTTANITDLIIWGQPYYHQIADVCFSRVTGYDGAIWGPYIKEFSQDTREMVHDDKWLSGHLADMVIQKNPDAKQLKSESMAMSHAATIVDQLCDLYSGVKSDVMTSLCVASQGWYGVPEGLVFSFPVTYTGSGFKVVDNLELDEVRQAELILVGEEIKSQCNKVLSSLSLTVLK